MQLSGDADLAAAVADPDRVITARLLVDWGRDGLYQHEVSDLTPWHQPSSWGRALTGDLPAEVSLVEGSAAATMTVTLGGVDDAGRSALEVFSLHRPESPLWLTPTVGATCYLEVVVATDAGPRAVRQFTGTVRSIRPDSRARAVTLTAIDPADGLRAAITLPAYGQHKAEVLASGHRFSINPQWVIDHVLRGNGLHASPPARDDAQISCTAHGALAAERGHNAVPRGACDPFPADESWWIEGPFGMLASRGIWSDTHAAYGEFFGREAFRPVPGQGVGIAAWVYVGNDMADLTGTANYRAIFQLMPLVDHQALRFELGVFASGSIAGYAWSAAGGFSGGAVPTGVTEWRYVGMHWQILTPTSVRITWRFDGITYGGNYTLPPLTSAFAARLQMTAWTYRSWSNMQVWYEPDPPSVWPGETHTPEAVIETGLNELLYLPDVVGADSWSLIQEVAKAEYGVVGFDEWGTFFFSRRNSLLTDPNTVEREITADRDLLDLASEVNVDSVRNAVSIETVGAYLDFSRPIVDSDDERLYESPVGVWTHDVALPHGAIGTTTQTIPQLTTAQWQDTERVWGFVAVRSDLPDTEVPAGVTVTYVQTGDRTGQLTVRNYSQYPVRFATTGGSPALRVVGWSLRPEPARIETVRSEGSIEAYKGERAYPIPASPWRQQPGPLRDVAGGLLAALSNPVPVIDGVRVRGDPRLQLGDTVRLVDAQGIGPGFRASVVKIDLAHDGGLTGQLAVRPIVSPGLGLLDDDELGLLDDTLVLAP